MLPFSRHGETHLSSRAGWLRASVLGADDGIVSTASLVLGVAAADGTRSAVLAAGVAGLVAGALSMAAGEYVSVASQRDVEEADVERERSELARQPEAELEELVRIYTGRGLTEETARRAARELTERDALTTHVRDELGLVPHLLARPWQAAGASAAAFSLGAIIPIVVLLIAPAAARTALVVVTALAALALLGTLGAAAGGAARRPAAARVLVGGAVAMAATWAIGSLVGAAL
jgi:VIT1/CCC1 family predicted Fe2+/Mn2+ transporter